TVLAEVGVGGGGGHALAAQALAPAAAAALVLVAVLPVVDAALAVGAGLGARAAGLGAAHVRQVAGGGAASLGLHADAEVAHRAAVEEAEGGEIVEGVVVGAHVGRGAGVAGVGPVDRHAAAFPHVAAG